MNYTRILMSSAAIVLAVLGFACSFLPEEVLRMAGAQGDAAAGLLIQVTGALYFGFAALDWMTRDAMIGGIYNRPLVVGNLMHFVIAALALVKYVTSENGSLVLLALALVYGAFAFAFGAVMFRHPVRPDA